MLENLERLLSVLGNKVRFILGVVSGEIVVSNRRKADLLIELQQKGFSPFPKKSKSVEPQVAGADDNEQETDATKEQENSPESVISVGVRVGDYEYLLSMPIGSLTIENVEKLLAERDEKEKEYDILKATPPTSMWMKDLDEIEKKLDVSEN